MNDTITIPRNGLYRIECVCANEIDGKKCGSFLMGSGEKPHWTADEIHKKWTGLVISAPLNAPRCPTCNYSTDSDYNACFDLLIDDGNKKIISDSWFKPAEHFISKIEEK